MSDPITMSEYDRMMKPILERLRLRKRVQVDEVALREAQVRADHARRLLEDEVLTAAFDAVETVYMEVWKNTRFDEVDKREHAHQVVGVLRDVKTYLKAAVEMGDAAQRELSKSA
jgi:hypothetical protein